MNYQIQTKINPGQNDVGQISINIKRKTKYNQKYINTQKPKIITKTTRKTLNTQNLKTILKTSRNL